MRFILGMALMPVVACATVCAEEPAKDREAQMKVESVPAANAQNFGVMVRRIGRGMASPADIKADKVPLSKFIEDLSKQYDIPFKIDDRALADNNIKLDVPITATIKTGMLNQALKKILTEHNLGWVLHDTQVTITFMPKVEAPPAREAKVVANPPRPAEPQFLPQFRALFKSELYFVGKVCDPTKEQIDAIQAKAEATTTAACNRFHSMNVTPRSLLQESLAPVLKAHLKPEQLARYNDEIVQRQTDRKKMVVDNLVAQLDRDLVLSATQREQLGTSLASHWDDRWCRSSQALLSLDRVFPAIPDTLVRAHLDARQFQTWQTLRRRHVQGNVILSVRGFGLLGNEIDETVWGVDGNGENAR